ncbi:MAG: cobalamin biosynthesis protein CobQ [Pseudomonadota bacterium]
MNTATHMLVASAALARRGAPARNSLALAGALLPDLSIFTLYFWGRLIDGQSSAQIWRITYWSEPWQTFSAVSNSIPLWASISLIGLATRSGWIAVLGMAGLLHVLLDFPVHNDDAHRHFWPLSDWRFISPLSYWDNDHHGREVAIAEMAFGAILIGVLGWRFTAVWARTFLALAFLSYAAVPIYFWATLG